MAGLWPYCFWCFNTQPPEGGWLPIPLGQALRRSFNTQPPEGGWLWQNIDGCFRFGVSTHSRPKAAGMALATQHHLLQVFQHTAARRRLGAYEAGFTLSGSVSTHSRPKAAGRAGRGNLRRDWRFNTQPPEGGWNIVPSYTKLTARFNTQPPEGGWL